MTPQYQPLKAVYQLTGALLLLATCKVACSSWPPPGPAPPPDAAAAADVAPPPTTGELCGNELGVVDCPDAAPDPCACPKGNADYVVIPTCGVLCEPSP